MAGILKMLPQLSILADHSGQSGAADYIEYFLTQPYTGGKIPTLLLFHQKTQSQNSSPLSGAVLLHQYQKLRVPIGIYVSEDSGGERNVIASPDLRNAVAVQAIRHLMSAERGRLVLMSLQNAYIDGVIGNEEHTPERWASTTRELKRYLPLQETYEDTLRCFGSHTRRNFRLYRRRISDAGGCTFEPHADLTEAGFLELNKLCDYEVPHHVALWRYRSTHKERGAVFAGLRTTDGRWLSILGGRRYRGILAIDWQMNLSSCPELSPSTLMRGYIIEHEISVGSRRILFEGGTPHPMKSALITERVTDIMAVRNSALGMLLQQHAHRMLPEGNFLKQTLLSPTLTWYDGMLRRMPEPQH